MGGMVAASGDEDGAATEASGMTQGVPGIAFPDPPGVGWGAATPSPESGGLTQGEAGSAGAVGVGTGPVSVAVRGGVGLSRRACPSLDAAPPSAAPFGLMQPAALRLRLNITNAADSAPNRYRDVFAIPRRGFRSGAERWIRFRNSILQRLRSRVSRRWG